MKKRKRLSGIAYKLQMTRWRQKAWRDNPAHMEAIRGRAIKNAAYNRKTKHIILIDVVSLWPKLMTPKEFKIQCLGIYPAELNVRSLVNRLTRHKLMAYDAGRALWVNQCNLEGDDSDATELPSSKSP